ncbi:MAG: hypothetical protein Q9187_003276 [Circinaria calcarea]
MLRNRPKVVDIELAEASVAPARLDGYPSFADFIAKDRDAAIYRKFERLSARSLLYQQSELHELERQLEQLDWEDATDIGNEEAQQAARYWTNFIHDTNDKAYARQTLQGTIRVKLKEYHEAMLLEAKVLSLNSPTSRTLRDFRKWFVSNSVPVLWGRDKDLYKNELDLVALAPVDSDRLNNFLKRFFGWIFKERREDLPHGGDLFYFPERRIQRAGAAISAILSAILLIGAIVCLLGVSNKGIGIRTGMIVLFTCLFAAVVGLLTNARRAEIFGSTAA